jgi:hypothetical protein
MKGVDRGSGLIRDTNQVKRAIDFTGIEGNKIHPSDIDAVLEFDNRLLILIETKHKGMPLPLGQGLLLQRIADAWNNSGKGKIGLVLVVYHSIPIDAPAIPLEACNIAWVYMEGKWVRRKRGVSLVDSLNGIGEWAGVTKCKF